MIVLSECAVMTSSTLCHLLFRFIESPVKPKKLKLGFFSWVWPTLQYSEQDIVRLNGTDAALYIRVQRFGGCTRPAAPFILQCPAAGLQTYVTGTGRIFPACRHGAICVLHAMVLHHPPAHPHHPGEQADVLCSLLSLFRQQPSAAAAASLPSTHLLPLRCRATTLTSRYKLAAQPTLTWTRWGNPEVCFIQKVAQHALLLSP